MIETASNGSIKTRGRGVAVALALSAALLFPGDRLGTVAQAQSTVEAPPVLQASELAPPDLLTGPTFVVDDQVPIQGMLGQFIIRSDVGTFEAHGREVLRIRVGELHALTQIERMSKSEEFLKAAGRAVARPVESTAQMLLHPVETAKGMPGGVERFFDRVELGAQTLTGAASDPGQSGTQRAEDITKRVGGLTADVFGYEAERRALAKSLGVDPYTTNPVLSKKLSDMAWVAFSGRVGVNTLISVFVPVSTAISAASVTNTMIYDTPAADLISRNEHKLMGLGASDPQARALIKNPWYSLSVLTSLVTALDRLSGVDGCPAVVALATTATTEDQARFLANAVEMLAAHHQTVEPLAEVMGRGTVIGRTPSGTLLVPGAVDYVAWTDQVASFAGRADLQGTPGNIWITGRMSPAAQSQFAALGWTVYQHVLPPWQR
jgi:hypothetical protein